MYLLFRVCGLQCGISTVYGWIPTWWAPNMVSSIVPQCGVLKKVHKNQMCVLTFSQPLSLQGQKKMDAWKKVRKKLIPNIYMVPVCSLKTTAVKTAFDAHKVWSGCALFVRNVGKGPCVWQVSEVTDCCLLSRPTNAQHIYINNILYIVSTPTCSDAPALSSWSTVLLRCWSHKIINVTKSIKSVA